ncbi:MAG TPA: hypothetical protein VFX50_04745 [Gemmatimonadales bacterium]|nr:hypothetical protein [Gemmatimonadales bacterium]
MTRRILAASAALAAAVACSNVDEVADGVIALELRPPIPTTIELGDTAKFNARALDVNGDSVAAAITWVTADPANVEVVDAAQGLVVGLQPNVTGRVQAVIGSLRSGFQTLTVQARADTVRLVEPDTVTVASEESASVPLVVAVESLDPAGPVAQRNVIYEIVDPAIPDPALRPVEFTNGFIADTAATGPDGLTTGIQLRRVTGVQAPATVLVEVRALRLDGDPVPGSGQRFVVNFVAQGSLR